VQAIDRLHDALRQLCLRQLPDGRHYDGDGVLRLVTRELSWQGYVAVAFAELVELSSSSPLVARRLLAAFDDLLAVCPAERREPVQTLRDRLLSSADGSPFGLRPDVQGLGAGDDLIATH
jgi:uncharacterized membrane protein